MWICRSLLALLLLAAVGTSLQAQTSEGTVRVFLLLSQRTGPEMLTKIVGDIGTTEPTVETWDRRTTVTKKLPVGSYTIVAKNVEACTFSACVPCPEQSRSVTVIPNKQTDVTFRWRAKYDRIEKKWICQ